MKKLGKVVRETMVTTVKDGVDKKGPTFLMNYSGLSSAEMSSLRKNLRKVGARVYVTKNAIIKRALQDLSFNPLADTLDGQAALVWGGKDSSEVSKVLTKFAKGKDKIKIRGGVLEGALIEQGDVIRLSELPSREVLLATLMGTIQSPLTRLASALNAKTRDLLSILKQLSEKKGGK